MESYWIDFETYYQPYIIKLLKKLLPSLTQRFGLQLLIDGSKVGNYHMMLMISVYFRGRSQAQDIEANEQQKFTSIPNLEFTERREPKVNFVLW
ncbi:MAG: hypothetical protein AAGG68_05485 [Bacteroidota bacterium]